MGHPKILHDTKGNISSEEKAIRVDAREELFKQQPLINITPPDWMAASARSEWNRIVPTLKKDYPLRIHYFNVFVSELDTKLETNIRFNSDQLLETDPETKVKNVLDQVKGSLLTINEGRSKMGLPPMDGGDRLLASLNFTYLDTLEKYQLKEQEGVTPVE